MHVSRHHFLFVLAVLAVPLAAQAAPHYAYIAVGLTTDKSVALSISNSGNVAGRTSAGEQAFLYSHQAYAELGALPGDAYSIGYGVNNAGQVVGMSGDHAFLYSHGTMIDLGSLDSAGAAALGINDAGHVVGWSRVAGGQFRAFLYRDGAMHSLGTLPGATYSYANAINNRGQVTGTGDYLPFDPSGTAEHAFLYENGIMNDLGSLGGPISKGIGINDFGQVVGMSNTLPGNRDLHHAILYANGLMRDLGTPVAGTSSQANGINNLGQVVGWYTEGHGRAFIYGERGGMRDLGALVDPASGWYIHAAYGINDRQQIVALGCKNGQYGAVLLNPTHRDGLLANIPETDAPPPKALAGAHENPACPYG